jgi:hypothetical protein
MPGIADRSMVKNVIRSQQRKLREEMKDIVKQKATQSAYPALSRQDKRVAEFHHDRLTQEQSLQKDTKKAERLARRIAQILDQLRKDFNKIKNFLGNYNFANTVGMDSSCTGACAEDLSTAVDTRQAWKRELENMLTMVWHYVDAQHLGDYALLHQPVIPADPTCGSASGTPVNCCPKVYRPFFHYYTPDGDCLGMATEAGSHSGDSSAVTPKGNYNDVTTRGCILGYKPKDSPAYNPSAENKNAPGSHKHFQITNKDAEIRQLWRLLASPRLESDGTTLSSEHREAWWSFLVANAMVSGETGAVGMKAYFDNTICLPAEMSTLLDEKQQDENGVDYQSVYEILVDFATGANAQSNGTASKTSAPPSPADYAAPAAAGTDAGSTDSGAFDESLKHAPTVCNVEDEPDLQFIIKLVTCVMENIRKCQINNDREQSVIEYVREVSECNEAYHQDVFSEMTSIDESELGQRYAVGKELCADLDSLYKENCVSKQTFFNDITLDGCCW